MLSFTLHSVIFLYFHVIIATSILKQKKGTKLKANFSNEVRFTICRILTIGKKCKLRFYRQIHVFSLDFLAIDFSRTQYFSWPPLALKLDPLLKSFMTWKCMANKSSKTVSTKKMISLLLSTPSPRKHVY